MAALLWALSAVAGNVLRTATLQPGYGADQAAVIQWIEGVARSGVPWQSVLPFDRPGWWDRSHFTPGLTVFVPLSWLGLPPLGWPAVFAAVYLSAAIPLYRVVARVGGSPPLAMAATLIWLWNPYTVRIAVSGLHEGPLIAALTLWGLEAGLAGRLLPMAGMLSLALMMREDSFVPVLALAPMLLLWGTGRFSSRAARVGVLLVLVGAWLTTVNGVRPRVSEFVTAQWVGVDAGETRWHDVLVPNARRFEGNPEGWRADALTRLGVVEHLSWPSLAPSLLAPEVGVSVAALQWAAIFASPNGIKSIPELLSDRNVYHLAMMGVLGALGAAVGLSRLAGGVRRILPRRWRGIPWEGGMTAGWLVMTWLSPQGPGGADAWTPFEGGGDALQCWREHPPPPATPTPWGLYDRTVRAPRFACGEELASAWGLISRVPGDAALITVNPWLPMLADREAIHAYEFAWPWRPRWMEEVDHALLPGFVTPDSLGGQWRQEEVGIGAVLWRREAPPEGPP